jgi:hypothetical protein
VGKELGEKQHYFCFIFIIFVFPFFPSFLLFKIYLFFWFFLVFNEKGMDAFFSFLFFVLKQMEQELLA